jgi:hypothetical protein
MEIEEEIEREQRRRHRSRSRHHHHHRRHRSRPREEDPKWSPEMQAQIDAVRSRLESVMDDPYAKEIMAAEGIKFDESLLKHVGGIGAAAT